MTRHFIDLSMPLENDVRSDPDIARPRIEYVDHDASIERIQTFFPDLRAEDLPDAKGWAIERIHLTTHNGTHLDAPYHFHPTMNHAKVPGGEPALTIDEVPLEWWYGPGVKLDFRHFPNGYVVTQRDVARELERIEYDLCPGDIVLVNTAAGAAYGRDDYVDTGCGMGRDATLSLLEKGVRLTGTDAWSWDAPFVYTKQAVQASGNKALIWEGHKAGRDLAYCHLEKLHNLESLPPHGFIVSCFPVKIKRASAGWTRAVAIME